MKRRAYLVAASTSVLLGGCLDSIGNTDNEGSTGDDPASGETEHGAVVAAEAYAEAATDEDREAVVETMHSAHPFNPANREEENASEWTVEWNDFDDPAVELRDEEFSTADIEALPSVEFWFEADTLDSVLDGEEAALVTLSFEATDGGETEETEETVIMLTEDGEWTVFFPYEEPPEIPDGEPVDDLSIVDEIEFDEAEERAKITFVDSVDADVSRVYVYSTSLQQENWIGSSEDTGEFTATFFTSAFDPEGDEIVVTAVVDDEERVVHRETYEPDE